MRKLLLSLLILITFNLFPVSAQLKVINPNGHAVSLALGFYNETGLIKGWHTQGWINIAPHDSAMLLPNGIVGGEVYYFGRISGCDQLYQGQYSLHIQPKEAFSIANSASDLPISLNKGLEKAPFTKVSIPNGGKTFTLRLPEVNCTQKGMRQGAWTLYLDRDKEEVKQAQDAAFIRKINYQNGVPSGLVRDYYAKTNVLQWDGKLISEKPDVRQGTSITYSEQGQKVEEAFYQSGKPEGKVRRWDADGKEIVTKKTYRTVTVLKPQVGYLVSYYNSGNSRTYIPVILPENTVEWYYEFTAYRNEAELQAAQEKFKLASELTLLIDQTGMLKLAADLFTAPPGGDICNVYMFEDEAQVKAFMQKRSFTPVRDWSRTSLKSAVVPVHSSGRKAYLGLHNPADLDGIHFAIEVVAVVEKEEIVK
ncbi:DUF1036 domain-containing protein [Pontibacter cellulosilyticus]|uniref:DUF1036 domain-containing protein n=1 Tax=Pontibacter cellulosilyticus TaxID=1720253 RepID=A0A923N9W3_9BACT|nr:DUF1036 domain-containing protein [Pontibacter cellulosilyticus]MBC5994021.1 DUF1036 domain-containing protein [Pontibacter cellulosilyticus]